MEDGPAMSIQRWAEAPSLPDIHLALQLLSISEHYLSATWRDSCCQHLTQTLWQHQPGDTLSLASTISDQEFDMLQEFEIPDFRS